MLEPSHSEPIDSLLQETVSDDELRIILDRLGHEEFGDDPATTVQDIVEGTGADPVVIGRILADVRKEEFEKRFGLQLQKHEQRIDEHEERIERIENEERKPPVTVINQAFVNSPTPVHRAVHEEPNTFFQGFDEPEPKQDASLFEIEHEDYEELKAIANQRRLQRQISPYILFLGFVALVILFLMAYTANAK